MKFVFFGYDFSLGILQRLVNDGHICIGVMSFECDNIFNFNTALHDFAKSKNISFDMKRPEQKTMDDFVTKGCEVFLSAGYPYKIPPVDAAKAYAMNFHPSLLPVGRGIMPTPHILLHSPEASGVTLHKMTEDFDAGDILKQQAIQLRALEDVETLSARIAMLAPELISGVMADLPTHWKNAKPQDAKKAVHWDPPNDEMRMLDWNKSVAEIEKTGRAFGRYGSVAAIEGKLYGVFDFAAWQEAHTFVPGTIVLQLSRETIIAAKDGFVCLKEVHEMA